MPDLILYFAQHGLAVDKADNPTRPLSSVGVQQTNSIATLLRERAIPVTNVSHSKKLRAKQTADIFANVLQLDTPITNDYFSPGEDVRETAEHLTTEHTLYIGHLPHLDKLIAYLVTGDENNHVIKFRNSAVACLSLSGDHFHIDWYLIPELTGK